MINFNQKLLGIAKAMARLPYADKIKVFGSMAEGSLQPGDIDVFVDLSDTALTDDSQYQQFSELIKLARRNYGFVDPFLRFKNTLIVRNDTASGWTRASNARAMRQNMDEQAKPLKEVIAHYSQFAAEVDETPSP
jgi:predicted nucleotidyltransferase